MEKQQQLVTTLELVRIEQCGSADERTSSKTYDIQCLP